MRSTRADKELTATAPGTISRVRVVTVPANTAREDTVAVESALEVRIGNKPLTVLMRTPGHDAELVTGFFFSEGVIADADDLQAIEPVAENIVNVRLHTSRRVSNRDRLFFSNSSCGICGKQSLDAVEVRGEIVDSPLPISREVLGKLPQRLRDSQPVFAETGGVHASGLFTATGELVALREDVGRHNALDKVIGWALNEGRVPLTDRVLVVSGRVSYELVQKAVAAGIPILAAVGAPSSLAVEIANQFGITLVGFLREQSCNVYTHANRIC